MIDNKQQENMYYCESEDCSSYFYKIEGSKFTKCFGCRFKDSYC